MQTPDRPNFLFFFTDDQRFSTVAACGNPHIRTPNLDALVARGCWFENAYIMGGTSGAVCMPSRAMLHSGRTLFHLDDLGQTIPAEHTMLGEHLQAHGYRTFGTGKWHQKPRDYARSFTDGAEIFFGGMNDHWNVPACDFDPSGNYPDPVRLAQRWNGNRVTHQVAHDHVATGKHSTDLFADAAIDWLNLYDGADPFFMYISFMAPHDPREMPSRFLNMYDPDTIPVPPNFLPEHAIDYGQRNGRDEVLCGYPRTEADVRRHTAEYYAMVSHLDNAIGRVLDQLEGSGLDENTIVIFAGDNGLGLGQHGLFGKQSVYDHSVHVPLLFAGPGIPAGETRNAFAYLLDIYPTLCDLIGLDVPETVEGRSLLPAFDDPDETIRDTLYFAFTRVARGIRDTRWKLVEWSVGGRRYTQLFDLLEDPLECSNLAAFPSCREHVDRLREQLLQWRDQVDDCREREASFWDGFDNAPTRQL